MAISVKNQSFNAASLDLGLGDQLQAETEAAINERKKKKLAQGAAVGLGPATQSLFSMSGGFSA